MRTLIVFVSSLFLAGCGMLLSAMTRPKVISAFDVSTSKPGKYEVEADFLVSQSLGRADTSCFSGLYKLVLVDSLVIANDSLQRELQKRFDENGKMFRGKFRIAVSDNGREIMSIDSMRYQANWGWFGGVPLESFFLPCGVKGGSGNLTLSFDLTEIDSLFYRPDHFAKIYLTKGGGK